MRIDLHTHSTASDGTVAPDELMRAAAHAGLDGVARTDHDPLAGWARAAPAATAAGIEFVPGLELSCRWYGVSPPVPLHLLAYYVDPSEPTLTAELGRVRAARQRRAEQIVALMRADGVDVTWDEVAGDAAGAPVGRPHLAQALIRRGLASSVAEAFAPSMLGQRWRLPKDDVDVFAGLALIRAAGGVAVFAHPRATRRGRTVPDELITSLAAHGLAGLEADHEDHTPAQRNHLRRLAGELGLLVTGSSDFHGANKTVRLGAHLTAADAFAAIRARAHAGQARDRPEAWGG
ncbi:MAG: PHP domain-containing protein [Micromonosporaceae bacterium]